MPEARNLISRGFTIVEDVVYVGLALLLTALVLTLLVVGVIDVAHSISSGAPASNVIALLDRILLILLIVELLYTVQVSFKAHALAPEPFLLVGLISAIRRVLLLTAQLGEQHEGGASAATGPLVLELAVLAGLILALAVALALVRRRNSGDGAAAETPTARR